MSTTWRVRTLAAVGRLTELRYLSFANLRTEDGSLRGLYSLRSLVTFRHANWWDPAEIAEVHRRNTGITT